MPILVRPTVPKKLAPERIVEQIDDLPIPQVPAEILVVEIDDGPVQHVVKDILEVLENHSRSVPRRVLLYSSLMRQCAGSWKWSSTSSTSPVPSFKRKLLM